MALPPPLLDVVLRIARRLDTSPITWAVTGSASLALQGVPVAVHDIDLRTTARDAYVLEALFSDHRSRPVRFSTTGAVQSHFGALLIDGIQVEIIGDMQHRLGDGSWEPVVDMRQFRTWVACGELRIPVMSLPFLHEAYRLLGRGDKVALLERWLAEHAP